VSHDDEDGDEEHSSRRLEAREARGGDAGGWDGMADDDDEERCRIGTGWRPRGAAGPKRSPTRRDGFREDHRRGEQRERRRRDEREWDQ
jgi:hypothetical protein